MNLRESKRKDIQDEVFSRYLEIYARIEVKGSDWRCNSETYSPKYDG